MHKWGGSLTGYDDFVRINKLGVYGDLYLTKILVCNLESGHTILLEISTAYKAGRGKKNFHIIADKDHFYFKATHLLQASVQVKLLRRK